MKKTNLKKLVIITMVLMLTSIILPQTSKAAVLQANPTTNSNPKEYQGQYWIANVRAMETTGQAMGLTEEIDSTTQLGTTGSNGIDVHMMKSTEYGAMAILSASGFGNPSNDATIDTTTGNKTGVYMQTTTYEWVAGAGSSAAGMSGSIAHRYFNTYTTSSSSTKPGDALDLVWHSPSTSSWLDGDGYGFFRGGAFGVFGFNRNRTSYSAGLYGSRASVVCGAEL